jgi:hypothetical protein
MNEGEGNSRDAKKEMIEANLAPGDFDRRILSTACAPTWIQEGDTPDGCGQV